MGDEPGELQLPNIDDVELHTLTNQLPGTFFNSIRADYEGFNVWFHRVAREGRRAWVYREGADQNVEAICIYTVQTDEPITDETLDARKQQAIAVYQNRAWKMLLRL